MFSHHQTTTKPVIEFIFFFEKTIIFPSDMAEGEASGDAGETKVQMDR